MRFAVFDTNVLIDWAEGVDDIPACFEVIRERIPGITIIIPPTVLQELGHFVGSDAKELGRFARKALEFIRA